MENLNFKFCGTIEFLILNWNWNYFQPLVLVEFENFIELVE